jgi:hypothetical protein
MQLTMRSANRILACSFSLLLTACAIVEPIEPTMCLAVVSRAVEVEVRDAATGAPAAAGTIATAREGAFTEQLTVIGWTAHPADSTAVFVGGVDERPGTYEVRIEKQGYQPWVQTGVRAPSGPCGVVTARLEARLVRQPS